MPRRQGISLRSFGKLENELILVAKRLSNRQLLELADDFHAMLRDRRSLNHASTAVEPFKGLNDNKRLTGRR